jgi:hypothetical protein
MMLEKNNKVINVGRAKFIELVLDVLQLLTLEELHCAITRIIKQIIHQEGLASTEGHQKDLCIRRAINLFYDQPSNLFNHFPTLPIRNRMVVNTKMNHHSGHRLKSTDNIIDLPTAIGNTKGRRMKNFASK